MTHTATFFHHNFMFELRWDGTIVKSITRYANTESNIGVELRWHEVPNEVKLKMLATIKSRLNQNYENSTESSS